MGERHANTFKCWNGTNKSVGVKSAQCAVVKPKICSNANCHTERELIISIHNFQAFSVNQVFF